MYDRHKIRQEEKGNGFGYRLVNPEREISKSITTRADRYISTFIVETPKSEGQGELDQRERAEIKIAGDLNIPGWFDCITRVYDPEGIAPALNTKAGDSAPKIEVAGHE